MTMSLTRGKYMTWSPDDMFKALEACERGVPLTIAANEFLVPRKTLEDRLKKMRKPIVPDDTTSVLTVTITEPDSEEPVVKTQIHKYSYDNGDNEEPELHSISIPETNFVEEDSINEIFGVNEEATTMVDAGCGSEMSKGLSGVFKCFRCEYTCTSTKYLVNHYRQYRKEDPFTCFQCGYKGQSKDDFTIHSQCHFEDVYFKCCMCSYRAESSSEMKDHLKEHNPLESKNIEGRQCPLCQKVLSSRYKLKLHLIRCKGQSESEQGCSFKIKQYISEQSIKEESDENSFSEVFTCPHCFFIFSSQVKLKEHVDLVHFKGVASDDVGAEGKRFKSEDIKREPNEDAGDVFEEVGRDMNPSVQLERIYLCPICHYVFTSVSPLNKHVVTHKSVTECPVCKIECRTNFELKEHVTIHNKEDSKYLCTVCDKRYGTLHELKYHTKVEHSKGYRCPICPKRIKTDIAYRLHLEAHSKMKEYYCPKCKFTARNSSVLQYHMSMYHRPKKRFVCQGCNKAYKYRYSLQRHLLNCPGKEMLNIDDTGKSGSEYSTGKLKKRLTCSECRANFKEATHLKRHLLIHFQSAPYRCMRCGLRCRTKYNLSRHMKIHNIKANYQCKICLKRFKYKHALNNHSIIHSDKRPFNCEICGMTFKRKANYRRHYDIHSEVKPFQCPFCSFSVRRKDGLQKHILTHKGK